MLMRSDSGWSRWLPFVVGAAGRELRQRYARSLLGWLWLLLPPAVFIAIYTLVFGFLARGAGLPDRGPYTYSLFLCAGLFTWTWFAEVLSRTVGLFSNNAALLKKTMLPWGAVLATDLLVSLVGLAIQMGLFALLLVVLHAWPGWSALLYLPLLAVQGLLAVGLGLGLAVVQVFVRDVGLLVPLGLQVWFWATPIIYTVAVLPQEVRAWLGLNPMMHLAQAYQAVVLHSPAGIRWSAIGALAAAGLLLLCGSVRLVLRNLGAIYDEL